MLNKAEENKNNIESGAKNKYNKISKAVILEFTESNKTKTKNTNKINKNYKTNLNLKTKEESNDLSCLSL